MKNALMLSVCFFLSVGSLQAQSGDQSSKKNQKSQKPGPATIRGCLQRIEGHYVLVDETNTAKRLSDSSKLKQLVGHEVELTGTPRIRTIDTSQPGIASSAIEQPYFEVKTVQDIAAKCQ